MDWDLLQKHNGIGHSGNFGKGDPYAFTIVGIDKTFDELAALVPDGDTKALAILRRGGRDVTRLKDDLPDQWINGFDLTGETDPIHFWQFIDKNGHSWAIVTNGRSRTCACRIINEKRKAEKPPRPPIKLLGEPDTYLSAKSAEIRALRLKRIRNRSIPDSLCVLAESAGEFAEMGLDAAGVAEEMGVAEERAAELLKWAKLLDRLCDPAIKLVNAGKMRYGAAIRFVKRFPSKQEQAEFLASDKKPRREAVAQRPLSPRMTEILHRHVEQEDTPVKLTGRSGFMLGLRLASGDKNAIEELPEGLRAAWLRAVEEAAKKPRKGNVA